MCRWRTSTSRRRSSGEIVGVSGGSTSLTFVIFVAKVLMVGICSLGGATSYRNRIDIMTFDSPVVESQPGVPGSLADTT